MGSLSHIDNDIRSRAFLRQLALSSREEESVAQKDGTIPANSRRRTLEQQWKDGVDQYIEGVQNGPEALSHLHLLQAIDLDLRASHAVEECRFTEVIDRAAG